MNLTMNFLTKLAGAALCAAFVVSAPLAPLAAQTPAAPGELNQAAAALRAITTLRANFTQTDRNGQRVSGVLTMKAPGRVRFQYQQGVPLLIVADGRSLTLIDYEVRQVQRWPIGSSPLGALLDPKRDVARFGTLKPTNNPNVVSIEVRDRSHPEYGVFTLIFIKKASAPGGLELANWVAIDSQNKMTRIDLSGHQYGAAVPDNTFRWTDPRPASRR